MTTRPITRRNRDAGIRAVAREMASENNSSDWKKYFSKARIMVGSYEKAVKINQDKDLKSIVIFKLK